MRWGSLWTLTGLIEMSPLGTSQSQSLSPAAMAAVG